MPNNEVSDPITHQEMAFALLILSGNMTDQQAAEAVGLNPNTAAYIKSKPCVRAYILERRDLMQQQIVEQETGLSRPAVEGLRRFTLGREQVLDRLWELAGLGPEMTRGSITGQVKAMSMIVAIEGLIPDRRAGSADKNPAPPPNKPNIYESEWLREQKAKDAGQPYPAPDQQDQQDDGLGISLAEPAPGSAAEAPPEPGPIFEPGESTYATEMQWPSDAGFVRDTRLPFSIKKNLFSRRP
jgi:hypothetical protein